MIEVRPLQPENAEFSILVTEYRFTPDTTLPGITKSPVGVPFLVTLTVEELVIVYLRSPIINLI
ncbi:hypothetical protein [Prevotella sp. Rep29]|uniref:hypothetical protein n=1 Tax=Prevotella sp. Rep29 TaxID=2691580 RepID=UPI0021027875|nr:hypothetical protein [Prevotella sp. Rep29]